MTGFGFELSVPADHPSLAGHFPGNPVVPGVLLLDEAMRALEQATGRLLVSLQQVKFVSALRPGELAQGRWELAGPRATFSLHVSRNGLQVKVAEGAGTLFTGAAQ